MTDADLLTATCDRLLAHHEAPAAELRADLAELLGPVLEQAQEAASETLLVTSPTSRPRRLKLAVLAHDRRLDVMYQQEWAELSLSSAGELLLAYRHRDRQGDYAVVWSSATSLPDSMSADLPEALADALLGGDG